MSLVEKSPLSSLPLVVTSVLDEIQWFDDCVDIAISRMLELLQELLQITLTYSWFSNFKEYFI